MRYPSWVRPACLVIGVLAVLPFVSVAAAESLPASAVRSAILAADPAHADRLYAFDRRGLLRSDDRGHTWRRMPTPNRSVHTVSVLADGTLRLLRVTRSADVTTWDESSDGGVSWTAFTIRHPAPGTLTSDPSRAATFFFRGTDQRNLRRNRATGAWSYERPPSTILRSLFPDLSDALAEPMGITGPAVRVGYLLRTDDRGATWRILDVAPALALADDEAFRVGVVAVDRTDPMVLTALVGVGGKPYTRTTRGRHVLIQSTDDGVSWSALPVAPAALVGASAIGADARMRGAIAIASHRESQSGRSVTIRYDRYNPADGFRTLFERTFRKRPMAVSGGLPFVSDDVRAVTIPIDQEGMWFSSDGGATFRLALRFSGEYGAIAAIPQPDGTRSVFISDRRGVRVVERGTARMP